MSELFEEFEKEVRSFKKNYLKYKSKNNKSAARRSTKGLQKIRDLATQLRKNILKDRKNIPVKKKNDGTVV